ncbi:hypothetical protein [Prosthecomicrobium sp. N25]|uniref:hypothetical protein n=1 Tax=Prosthecomicrobium sp. N25 TaxID=3129254 RepID=UPI003077DF57
MSGWDFMTASECADWWNDVIRTKVRGLQAYSETKGYGADTTAGFCLFWGTNALQDAADLLVIDNLRLGDGAGAASAGGSKWGYLADVGRFTAYIPLGRLVGMGSRAVSGMSGAAKSGTRLAVAETVVANEMRAAGSGLKVAPFRSEHHGYSGLEYLRSLFKFTDPASSKGICWAVSLVQALRHGGRYHVSLETIAKILGVRVPGALMHDILETRFLISQVRQLGALLDHVKVPHNILSLSAFNKLGFTARQVLEAMTPANKPGVLIFGVRWIMNGEEVGHILYAARNSKGMVQIFDRSGEVVNELGQLGHIYPDIGSASMHTVDSAIFIPNAGLLEGADNAVRASKGILGMIMIPVFLRPAIMPSGNPSGRVH